MRESISLGAAFLVVAGCSSPTRPPKYPALAAGCAVQLFVESPPMATHNIGTVSALCGDDIPKEDCVRTLKDEACRLGANVVWGVADEPVVTAGKRRFRGRAAHTR